MSMQPDKVAELMLSMLEMPLKKFIMVYEIVS